MSVLSDNVALAFKEVNRLTAEAFTLDEIRAAIEAELDGHSYAGAKYWAKRICEHLQARRAPSPGAKGAVEWQRKV